MEGPRSVAVVIAAFGDFVGVTVAFRDGERAPDLNSFGVRFVRFKYNLVHKRIDARGVAGERTAGANAEQGQEQYHEFQAPPTRERARADSRRARGGPGDVVPAKQMNRFHIPILRMGAWLFVKKL